MTWMVLMADLFGEKAKQCSVNLVDDAGKVVGGVLEVERVGIDNEHTPAILVEDEVLVAVVQVGQVVDGDGLLVVAAAFLDVLHEVRHRGTEINHQVGMANDVEHRLEQLHIGFEITVVEVAHGMVIGREHIDTLEDGAVLNDGMVGLGDVEQVTEALLQEVHLQCERPTRDVGIVILEVGIVVHSLEAWLPAVVACEHVGERCLSAPYVSCYCYMHRLLDFKEFRSIGVQTSVLILGHRFVHAVPPRAVALEPLLEPGEDGALPLDALVVVLNPVVLALDDDECSGTTEEFQGCIHLDGLADGHIRVGGAMHEQDRCMNLVGIVERRVINVEVLARPGIAVGHGSLAVAVAPIALTPVTGVVADAGMAHGSGKDVGLGLQVLRHESAVAGTETADVLAVDKRMFCGKTFRAFDDVVSHIVARRVDMSRCILLTKAGCTAGIDGVDHISLSGIHVRCIAALERSRRWRAATIVVDQHGILLRGIEVRRNDIASADGVATRVDEVPCLALAKLKVGVKTLVLILNQRMA